MPIDKNLEFVAASGDEIQMCNDHEEVIYSQIDFLI